MEKQLSIIIVNYNGLKYLKNCIDSIILKTNGLSYEIIILDNNSIDESCAFIKSHYPKVQLIESKVNYGFGKGNNEAFKLATGDSILLLNNDTILRDDLLPIVNYLKKDPTIGAIGIKMLDGNKQFLPASGDFPTINNMFWMKNIQKKSKKLANSKTLQEVDWLTGSFLLMPKNVFAEIDGFDEDYFLYVEDVDLCKRVADKKYKRIFLPQYQYTHFVGFSTLKNPLLVKGYELYISKHFKGAHKVLISFALSINKFVKNIKLFFRTTK
ncbi:glycosyltransferase family 2 protein [Flavobacterium qiangtangense]|uniref:Glycosyltransferase family 2 protein n=1 Tax=Flavobacterium qiangtangense TaxID=1442595 RepID=A0ABW1PQY1_9FLAO